MRLSLIAHDHEKFLLLLIKHHNFNITLISPFEIITSAFYWPLYFDLFLKHLDSSYLVTFVTNLSTSDIFPSIYFQFFYIFIFKVYFS